MIPFALVIFGCGADGDGAVPYSVLATCLHVSSPEEQVFRNAEDWQRFYAEHTEGAAAPAVDFGRAVLAAHFDGTGSACAGFTRGTKLTGSVRPYEAGKQSSGSAEPLLPALRIIEVKINDPGG